MKTSVLMDWSDDDIVEAGLDPAAVRRVALKLKRINDELEEMGLAVYVGNRTACIHQVDRPVFDDQDGIIASFPSVFDGGDF